MLPIRSFSRFVRRRKDRRELWLDIQAVLVCEYCDMGPECCPQLTQCDKEGWTPFFVVCVPPPMPSHEVTKVGHRLLKEAATCRTHRANGACRTRRLRQGLQGLRQGLPHLEHRGRYLGHDLKVMGDEKDAPILQRGEETSEDLALVGRGRPLD